MAFRVRTKVVWLVLVLLVLAVIMAPAAGAAVEMAGIDILADFISLVLSPITPESSVEMIACSCVGPGGSGGGCC